MDDIPSTSLSTPSPTPTAIPTPTPTPPPAPALIKNPVLYTHIVYVEPVSHDEAVEQLKSLDSFISSLSIACTSGLYEEEAIRIMQGEIDRINEIKATLYSDIDKFLSWEEKYPDAAEVWYFLKEHGYNDAVAAGIIGNMMIETSGGSLALEPIIYDASGSYYGLCQWSSKYHSKVIGTSIEEQLEYLDKSMPKEFKTFGFCYKKGFTYEDFLNLESPEDAAYAFAVVYERCASGSYGLRKNAAVKAFNYFTKE